MKSKLLIGILLFIVFGLGSVAGIFYKNKTDLVNNHEIKSSSNKYVVFLDEVYRVIQENYWDKVTDEKLGNTFVLGTEKLTGQPQNVKTKNKQEVFKMLDEVIGYYDTDDKKKEFVTTLADLVLSNLEPFERSRLYAMKDEKALSNVVQNKNPEINRYEDLGVSKDATKSEVEKAYLKESEKWNPETNKSPEAKQKYEEIQKAYEVLSDDVNRQNYNIAGIEPTLEYKTIGSKIFYMHLTKFSPTSFDEINRVVEKADSQSNMIDTLIFDLRDNIGGAIDGLPYFLGPFIGVDQYAYQFLRQGEKIDYKTRTGWLPSLVRYKKVIVLINENAQSTAEVMASVLKKYNVGVVVGTPTKGWGTVERIFTLESQIDDNEKYSIFLVHSITLREDGQPIEGRGVEPLIDIRNKNWEQDLFAYFENKEVVNAVKKLVD